MKTNQLQRIIRTGRTGHWLNHGKEHCLVGTGGLVLSTATWWVQGGGLLLDLGLNWAPAARVPSSAALSPAGRGQGEPPGLQPGPGLRCHCSRGESAVPVPSFPTFRPEPLLSAAPSPQVRSTSHKPDEIYGMIERLSPGTRKIELFGRPHNVQPNW